MNPHLGTGGLEAKPQDYEMNRAPTIFRFFFACITIFFAAISQLQEEQ